MRSFILRMVEHICYIEHSRRTVRESQGRTLSSQEAAIEWIEYYADIFPISDANADRPQDNQK
jgi:hypothetical protein